MNIFFGITAIGLALGVVYVHPNGVNGETTTDETCAENREKEFRNQEMVVKMYQEVFGDHDPTSIDRYMKHDYIQHNPLIADGTESVKEFIISFTKGKPKSKVDIRNVAAHGDYVWLHSKMTGFGGKDLALIDIFLIEDGKIAEHWDVIQVIPDLSESKNPHPMF